MVETGKNVLFTNLFQVKTLICDWLAKLLFMKRPSAAKATLTRWRPRGGLFNKKGDVEVQGSGGLSAVNSGVGVAMKATCSPRDSVVVNTSSQQVHLETSNPHSRTRTPGFWKRRRRRGTSGPSGSDETWSTTYNPVASPATSCHLRAYDQHHHHHDPAAPASVSSSTPNFETNDGDPDRLSPVAMNEILYELRLLTGRLRDEEARLTICSDWKFAAMVIDRFCLVLFALFTIVSTCAILFSAPHFTA